MPRILDCELRSRSFQGWKFIHALDTPQVVCCKCLIGIGRSNWHLNDGKRASKLLISSSLAKSAVTMLFAMVSAKPFT